MDLVRDFSLIVAALFIGGGLVAVVTLELRNEERRLVGKFRDVVEVLMPPVLTAVLLGLVWSNFS